MTTFAHLNFWPRFDPWKVSCQQGRKNLLGARSAMGLRSSGGRAKRPSFGDRFFKGRKKVRKHEALFMIIEKFSICELNHFWHTTWNFYTLDFLSNFGAVTSVCTDLNNFCPYFEFLYFGFLITFCCCHISMRRFFF